MIVGGICPLWAIISRISKNLIFDGMLYDIIMFTTYAVTMAALGAGDKFHAHQWAGAGLVLIGFVLMKL